MKNVDAITLYDRKYGKSILTSAGDDIVYDKNSASTTSIDLGAGFDTLVYSGNVGEYSFSYIHESSTYIVTHVPSNKTDSIVGVELFVFADDQVFTLVGSSVVNGIVQDGYISGAEIYIDTNGNFKADREEATGAFSNALGRFFFEGDLSGSVIVVGGLNTDTRLPNSLSLTAPEYSVIFSPITTLLHFVAHDYRLNTTEASALLSTAFGLPSDIDFTSYDPLGKDSSDLHAISVQKLNAQLAILASNSVEDTFWNNLAEEVYEAEAQIDLSSVELLNSVLEKTDKPISSLAASVKEIAVADSIAQIAGVQREAMINEGHKVAGLYAAVFNRAPDASGLAFWKDYVLVQGLSLDDLAAAFVTHPIFIETYGSLSDRDFVEAIYKNMLGGVGDQTGIDYWVNLLGDGMARSEMVSGFVQGSLVIDLDAMLSDGILSQPEYEDAVERQNFITHKAMAGVEFAERMGELSNVTSDGLDLLEDPAYLASVAALSSVNNEFESYDAVLSLIENAAFNEDPLEYLIENAPPSVNTSAVDFS